MCTLILVLPATTLGTESAHCGVCSRSWWNWRAMDASNPTEKKHTEVFVTTPTSDESKRPSSSHRSSKASSRGLLSFTFKLVSTFCGIRWVSGKRATRSMSHNSSQLDLKRLSDQNGLG